MRQRPVVTTVFFAAGRGMIGDGIAQAAERNPVNGSEMRNHHEEGFVASIDKKRMITFVTWTIGVGFVIDRYLYAIKV